MKDLLSITDQKHLIEKINDRYLKACDDNGPRSLYLCKAFSRIFNKGLNPEIANFVLDEFPIFVDALRDYGFLPKLCVDRSSFKKITFLLTSTPTAYEWSALALIYARAERMDQAMAERYSDFYLRYISWNTLMFALSADYIHPDSKVVELALKDAKQRINEGSTYSKFLWPLSDFDQVLNHELIMRVTREIREFGEAVQGKL